MEFEGEPVVPLFIRHFEDIDLRHCSRDIQQGIDSAKSRQGLGDDLVRRPGIAQIDGQHQRGGPRRFDGVGGFSQRIRVSRHEDDRGKVPGQADGRGFADSLTRSGDNRDRGVHKLVSRGMFQITDWADEMVAWTASRIVLRWTTPGAVINGL